MRLLLLGANGQVGHELRRSLAPLGEVVPATRDGRLADGRACEIADLARPETLAPLVGRLAPDWVLNAAAYTAVDQAESDPQAAFAINARAPGVLAEEAARLGLVSRVVSDEALMDEARKLAEEEGVALNQLINVAVAEKLSALRTRKYFEERASRADVDEALGILERAVLGNPPDPGDELPE